MRRPKIFLQAKSVLPVANVPFYSSSAVSVLCPLEFVSEQIPYIGSDTQIRRVGQHSGGLGSVPKTSSSIVFLNLQSVDFPGT